MPKDTLVSKAKRPAMSKDKKISNAKRHICQQSQKTKDQQCQNIKKDKRSTVYSICFMTYASEGGQSFCCPGDRTASMSPLLQRDIMDSGRLGVDEQPPCLL